MANREGVLLASAVRGATAASDAQDNVDGRGLVCYFDLSAVPGVVTVQLVVQALDPASGAWIDLASDAAQSAVGKRELLVYPGGAAGGAFDTVVSAPLPKTWRVRIVHSGAGNFTYSVGYSLVG